MYVCMYVCICFAIKLENNVYYNFAYKAQTEKTRFYIDIEQHIYYMNDIKFLHVSLIFSIIRK